jgi:hypothetical protein
VPGVFVEDIAAAVALVDVAEFVEAAVSLADEIVIAAAAAAAPASAYIDVVVDDEAPAAAAADDDDAKEPGSEMDQTWLHEE